MMAEEAEKKRPFGESSQGSEADDEDPQAQIKKLREDLAKRDEDLAKRDALTDGTYYASFHEVWKKGSLQLQEKYERVFMREKVPSVKMCVGKGFAKVYERTMLEASNADTVVKDDGQSARTSHNSSTVKDNIWPCDVLENDLQEDQDTEASTLLVDCESNDDDAERSSTDFLDKLKKIQTHHDFRAPDADRQVVAEEDDKSDKAKNKVSGQIAHLVPASPLHASLYYNVAKCVFALGNDVSEEAIQKLIHGCKRNTPNSNRIPGVGLKHFVSNKIRLSGQGTHYDRGATVLIVPILTVNEVCDWNGKGYEALFMIGTNKDGPTIAAVAAETRFLKEGTNATSEEIEIARGLLAEGIQFSMQSLWESQPLCLTKAHKSLLDEYRGLSVAMDGTKRVTIPESRNKEEGRPVRKIRFGPQPWDGTSSSNKRHPAPNPLLLVIKAAINWSKAHDQQLLASGEVDSDDDVSTLSGIAEQMYLDACQAVRRKTMDREIKGMMIGI